ncbi:MAG: ribonuclease HI family protein [Candidatus Aenigmarchaeota archaeon]|nr:ribonuclease HI family protein [Candidatus Aenigmarchaeota archaeon]
MTLFSYSDGGSRGNPGPAAIGVVIADGDRIILEHKERIGRATNNQAEYRALLKALELARRYGSSVVCTMDSELVVRQVTGAYRIRDPGLKKLHAELKERERSFGSIAYRHVVRTHPMIRRADALVNRALDEIT